MTNYILKNGHMVTADNNDIQSLLAVVEDYLSSELAKDLQAFLPSLEEFSQEQIIYFKEKYDDIFSGMLTEINELQRKIKECVHADTMPCCSLYDDKYMEYLLNQYIPETECHENGE